MSTKTTTKTNSIKTAVVLAIVLASLTSIGATAVPLQNVYATGTEGGDGGDGGEGCTPGFWKNRLEFWPISTSTTFAEAFRFELPGREDLTLLQALNLNGGGENALLRHAAAAFLNAASGEVDFEFTVEEVIAKVRNAIDTGNIESVKNQFDRENNRGCPI